MRVKVEKVKKKNKETKLHITESELNRCTLCFPGSG